MEKCNKPATRLQAILLVPVMISMELLINDWAASKISFDEVRKSFFRRTLKKIQYNLRRNWFDSERKQLSYNTEQNKEISTSFPYFLHLERKEFF